MNSQPTPASGNDQYISRRGQLVAIADGQASFRIDAPSCSACSSRCSRSRVEEVVFQQADVVSGVVLAPSSPVEACLYWSRTAMNRTALALYGLPLTGLVAGVVAASGFGDDSSRAGNEIIPALIVMAGVIVGMIGGWLTVGSRRPEDPTIPTMFIHSVDPGNKR